MNINYQHRLTVAKVRSAKCGTKADGSPVMKRYQDGQGLMLQVNPPSERHPTGSRSWVQRLTIRGVRRDVGIGSCHLVGLKEAREIALENLRVARRGGDPRVKQVAMPTFAECARKVHQQHAHNKNEQDRERWLGEIVKYVFPAIAHLPIDQITPADIEGIFNPIWNAKPTVAKRVRQRVSKVMLWAVGLGYRDDNPAGDALDAVLGNVGKGHVVKHHDSVPHGEVADAIAKIRASNRVIGVRLAFEFLILTAGRTNEVRNAEWEEIDLESRTWTIPGEKMKAGKEHRVPLSDRAIELLEQAREIGRNGIVFPNEKGNIITDKVLATAARKLALGGTPHGFRTSFRTWCQETGVPNDVAETAIAHVEKNKTKAAYARSDYFDARKPVMQDWADYLKT